MQYKGYVIKADRFTLPFGGRVSGFGIFKGDKRISIAETKELAMRYVDEKVKHEAKSAP